MEISAMSLDQLATHLSNPNLGRREETITVVCESGQKLYASRHVMPGWMCDGFYQWLVGDKEKQVVCKTYNGLWRGSCKQCKHKRDFSLAELVKFAKQLTGEGIKQVS